MTKKTKNCIFGRHTLKVPNSNYSEHGPWSSSIRLKCFHSYSSEKRGLCSMKSSNELLQNLPYFIYTKTQKWKKQLWVFVSIKFHKFWSEAIRWNFSSSINPFFLKSAPLSAWWGVSLNRKNPFTIFSKMFKCLTSVFFWHRLYCHERTR